MCGLCFTRRTRLQRPRYNGCRSPDPWAPLTGGQWRTILGPPTSTEGLLYGPLTRREQEGWL
jgi:hypothetical protein